VNDLTKGEAIRRADIAQKAITRHIGRMTFEWIEIRALQKNYPEATTDHDWDVLSQIQNELTDIFKEKKNG